MTLARRCINQSHQKTENALDAHPGASIQKTRRFSNADQRLADAPAQSNTGITRLFWAGLKIEEVAQVSGHSNWAQLKRHTHIRPEDVHRRWGQLTG